MDSLSAASERFRSTHSKVLKTHSLRYLTELPSASPLTATGLSRGVQPQEAGGLAVGLDGAPLCDLSCMPSAIRGAPTAPADAAQGYVGGRLAVIKVLGAG